MSSQRGAGPQPRAPLERRRSIRLSHPIYDAAETLPRERLRELQLERLRATVGRVLRGQPLGAERLAEAGITDARDLTSTARTSSASRSCSSPTCASSIRSGCWPSRVRSSSASTPPAARSGKPTVVAYTRADLDTWTELMARCMTAAGVRSLDDDPQRQRLRAVHRRASAFTRAASGSGRRSCPSPAGARRARRCCCAISAREVLVSTPSYALVIAQAIDRRRRRSGAAAAPAGAVRRRAVERGAAGRDRAGVAADGGQLLRPVGDVRSGRGRGVPGRAPAACTCRRTTSWSR